MFEMGLRRYGKLACLFYKLLLATFYAKVACTGVNVPVLCKLIV